MITSYYFKHLLVWYQEQCVDPYEDGICGEDALGQRLFVREDEVICDCDEVNIYKWFIFTKNFYSI